MSARLHTFQIPRTRCRARVEVGLLVEGVRGLGSFCHGRDGTNLIVLRPSIPYNAIAVDATERSLNYGRLCGEVAIKVIRLGSASVESLPNAVLRETAAYVLLISFANIRTAIGNLLFI